MELIFGASAAVKARIAAAEAREQEEVKRLEEAAQVAREAAMNESLVEEPVAHGESDEDADVPGESEEIRALKVSLWKCVANNRHVDVSSRRFLKRNDLMIGKSLWGTNQRKKKSPVRPSNLDILYILNCIYLI
jgi:hypothetical protein